MLFGDDDLLYSLDDKILLIESTAVSGEFDSLTQVYASGLPRYSFDVLYTDTAVTLSVIAVPEPETLWLLLLGLRYPPGGKSFARAEK